MITRSARRFDVLRPQLEDLQKASIKEKQQTQMFSFVFVTFVFFETDFINSLTFSGKSHLLANHSGENKRQQKCEIKDQLCDDS